MTYFGLYAPWVTFQKKVKELFKNDPDIQVNDLSTNDDIGCYVLNIEVRNHKKYVALDRVIEKQHWFGNVELRIVLFDEENSNDEEAISKLYQTIFEGNAIFKDTKIARDPNGCLHNFVRFEPVVLQFQNDDISDYMGNWSGLAQDIAKELFQEDAARGVHFCTAEKK